VLHLPVPAGGWQDVAGDVPGTWHSQCGQDCLVNLLLDGKRGGFFVDLAANEPITISNSRSLDFGWHGLCIEPNPRYHMSHLQSRTCTVIAAAVASTGADANFTFAGEFGALVAPEADTDFGKARGPSGGTPRWLSALSKRLRASLGLTTLADFGSPVAPATRRIRTVPFDELLRHFHAPSQIDYMSLDVEGMEAAVMDSFPWRTHRISLLSVERPKPRLAAMLVHNHYRSPSPSLLTPHSSAHEPPRPDTAPRCTPIHPPSLCLRQACLLRDPSLVRPWRRPVCCHTCWLCMCTRAMTRTRALLPFKRATEACTMRRVRLRSYLCDNTWWGEQTWVHWPTMQQHEIVRRALSPHQKAGAGGAQLCSAVLRGAVAQCGGSRSQLMAGGCGSEHDVSVWLWLRGQNMSDAMKHALGARQHFG
jgi:hypothetical protein